jgi:hypothetical protein
MIGPIVSEMRWPKSADAVEKLEDYRGERGGSEASELACEQRLAVDKLLEKKGCRNIYPPLVRMTRPFGCARRKVLNEQRNNYWFRDCHIRTFD